MVKRFLDLWTSAGGRRAFRFAEEGAGGATAGPAASTAGAAARGPIWSGTFREKVDEIVDQRRDPYGAKVTTIYKVSKDFAIYAARRSDGIEVVRFELAHEWDDELRGGYARLVPLMAQIDDLLPHPTTLGPLPTGTLVRWRRKLGIFACATQMVLLGHVQEAMGLLEAYRRDLEERRDSANRMRYVLAMVCGTLSMVVIWLLLSWGPLYFGSMVDFVAPIQAIAFTQVGDGVTALNVLAFGAAGAYFSVSLDVRKVRVRHAITILEMLYAGFGRILTGVIAAVVVILLIEGGWILGNAGGDLPPYTLYLFGFLAGFSERLVPNALKSAEDGSRAQPAAEAREEEDRQTAATGEAAERRATASGPDVRRRPRKAPRAVNGAETPAPRPAG